MDFYLPFRWLYEHQAKVAINSTETVNEKIILGWRDQSQVVVLKGYHTYNGIFNALEFMEDLLKNKQKISFSGAGTSHQNLPAERSINTVVTMTITMLMYSMLICTEHTFPLIFG